MLKEWKLILMQVIILLALLMVAIVGITLVYFPDKTEDLSLNLISEMIGTILSVFCIDRLLKVREEIHQLPTRYLWYTKLLNIVDDLLIDLLPEDNRKISDKIYFYKRGNLFAVPRLESLTMDESERFISQVMERFEKQYRSNHISPLSQAKDRLNTVIERSSSFFKEDEMMLILNFERSLERCLDLGTVADLLNESFPEDVVIALTVAIKYAVRIDLWLHEVINDNFTLVSSAHNNLS